MFSFRSAPCFIQWTLLCGLCSICHRVVFVSGLSRRDQISPSDETEMYSESQRRRRRRPRVPAAQFTLIVWHNKETGAASFIVLIIMMELLITEEAELHTGTALWFYHCSHCVCCLSPHISLHQQFVSVVRSLTLALQRKPQCSHTNTSSAD